MTTDNRGSEPTPKQVEAAAEAIYFEDCGVTPDESIKATDDYGSTFRELARAALVAAAGVAPPAPSEYAYCPIHGDLLAANRSYRCGNAPTGHEYAAQVKPSSTVDEAAHDAEVAAKALEDAADRCPLPTVGDWLRARAAEYRKAVGP